MRTIKEALRLHYELGLTMRQVAKSLHIAVSSASEVFRRAEAAGLSWPLPEEMDEAALERLLYRGNQGRPRTRPEPDWDCVHQEMRRKGVTLELLWMEYKQDHPDGYQYSQFCEHYRLWQKKLDVVLRQDYRAGEKMLVDYAGQTIPVVDRRTGEIHEARLFVSCLGASNYTYAEAHWNQDLHSWIGGHCHSFEYFGGVTEVVVPDNPKTGVKRASWYEPELNPTYQEMAAHYGTAIIPARPRKPRDKAKVEVAVQIAERWIIARLRHRTFYSLDEVNRAIRPLLEELNRRPFKKLEGSRQQLFESLDRPALKPLPAEPYEFAEWKKAKVNIDYHIDVDRNFYSVPYQLVGQQVDVRVSFRTVEAYYKGRRVASHVRVPLGKGQYRTDSHHRPLAHQAYLNWSPQRIINWAETIGPKTKTLVQTILTEKPHPEQRYRSCLGIIRLAKYYPPERVERAAFRALSFSAHSYRSFKSILEKGLDLLEADPAGAVTPVRTHDNVRGASYYAHEGGEETC